MKALHNLTVAITAYKRPGYLNRAIESCRKAGIRRIVVAVAEPDREIEKILRDQNRGWLSFDVSSVRDDIGCNNSWTLSAYRSRTARMILLHDDDALCPEFGRVYEHTIAPYLASGCGFASWRAWLLDDNGRKRKTEWFRWETRAVSSSELLPIVERRGRLSLSPVISVLDRDTIIAASKEAAATLTHGENLFRPGMLLGTEILVYLRHIQRFPLWLYVDRILSLYGSHAGSGTNWAERTGWGMKLLTRGYDRARDQGEEHAPAPTPKIIVVTYKREILKREERSRVAVAQESREFLYGTFEAIELSATDADLPRMFRRPNKGNLPYLRDLIDFGCKFAQPEDVVLYCNDDIGLTVDAPSRILAGIERGRGVAVCPRRRVFEPRALMRSVRNCILDGGVDAAAVTPAWWAANRDKVPDMLIGVEGWDTSFRVLAEEWADGGPPRDRLVTDPHEWLHSRAYVDDVCWHKHHVSRWQRERRTGKGDGAGRHNRKLFKEFFGDRANQDALNLIAESEKLRTTRK